MPTENSRPKQKSSRHLLTDLLISCVVAAFLIFGFHTFSKFQAENANSNTLSENTAPEIPTKYGFNLNEFHLETLVIKPGQLLGNILYYNGVNNREISELERKARDIYSVRKIKSGKELTIVKSDECGKAECLVYEPSPFSYVLFDLRDTISVVEVEKEYKICQESLSGEIESSLWSAMSEANSPMSLIAKMEDALGWSVDFPRAQKGDRFKLFYETKNIEGKVVAIGNLLGAYYENENKHYAIYYENDNYSGFYDLEGRATKRDFLKSPVRASYISSRYNPRRFHPILKRRKPHLGTDYAAPSGTPIRAVADGHIDIASYTKGNGKYVKVRHANKIQTQYLHMSRFASGMKRGTKVKQGQTIGYVGQTGLATGPHVCFRFWKNGRQVDHTRLNFPPPKPMDKEDLPAFFDRKKEVMDILDFIPWHDSIETQTADLKDPQLDVTT